MLFDPNNRIIQLCAAGMHVEGEPEKAKALFMQAWQEATTPLEICIAAHYVARQQPGVADKLKWDELSLEAALQEADSDIGNFLPSLYLNIGKGYEDLQRFEQAHKHYLQAQEYAAHLPDDGYSHLIRSGIQNGLKRLNRQ